MANTADATGQTLSSREDDAVAGPSWSDREAAAETMVPLIDRPPANQRI